MATIEQLSSTSNGDRTRSALILCAKAIVIAALGLVLGGGLAKFATTAVHWLAPIGPAAPADTASPAR